MSSLKSAISERLERETSSQASRTVAGRVAVRARGREPVGEESLQGGEAGRGVAGLADALAEALGQGAP